MRNLVTGTMAALAAVVVVSGFTLSPPPDATAAGAAVGGTSASGAALRPTEHPPFPTSLDDAWMVPPPGAPPAGVQAFAAGVQRFRDGQHARALIDLGTGVTAAALSDHATYYTALTYLRMSRPAEARAVLAPLRSRAPVGYLAEAVPLAAAEAENAAGDPAAALRIYEELAAAGKTAAPDEVLDRLARAALQVGHRARASEAWLRLYYEFPLSPLAPGAAHAVAEVRQQAGADRATELRTQDLARAERLFNARRYAEAKRAYELLLPRVTGDDAERVTLRIAASDHHLGRHRAAVDRLAPLLDRVSRKAEARYFHLTALRALGDIAGYEARARRLVAEFPNDPWTEEALDHLATHYIRANEDGAAARAFAQVLERFPTGRHAPRAAWRLGWWRYKIGQYREAAEIFERAAVNAPRSDYRPAWLYWAARARDRMADRTTANARFELVTIDYLNSYYGRLASRVLEARGLTPGRATTGDTIARHTAEPSLVRGLLEAPVQAAGVPTPGIAQASATPAALPPNSATIRLLIAAGLYDLAIHELHYAQRAWGPLASVDATLAWIHGQQGDMRRGINTMRRAYPQYMAVGGETLPREVLAVIFPIDYWDLIRKHSAAHGLDAYTVAALVAQESSFMPAVRSPANAYGLMQIIPSTGRILARAEGLGPFSINMLTNPELNVRMGTRHFAGLIRRFGGVHYALASYNAGESRIVRWKAERPGLDKDEFIDDIPFPETQIYVKKILGTAEDYRRLYGPGGMAPPARRPGLTTTSARRAAPVPTMQKPAPAAKKPAAKKPAAKKPAAKTPPAKKPAATKPATSGTKK
jgi:soluble lytic murein transglycosylase